MKHVEMLGATLGEFFRWRAFSSLPPSCSSYLIFLIVHFNHLNQLYLPLRSTGRVQLTRYCQLSVSNLSSAKYFHAFLLQVQESRLRSGAADTVVRGSSPVPAHRALWLQKKQHPLLFPLRIVRSSCCKRDTQPVAQLSLT